MNKLIKFSFFLHLKYFNFIYEEPNECFNKSEIKNS